MMGLARKLVVVAAAIGALAAGGTAQAQAPPAPVIGDDGRSAPAFGYTDAIRERVFIPLPGIDQDADGVDDRTAIDIIRPAAGSAGLKSPALIDTSPYLTTLCRGNEAQCMEDRDGDGLNDRWPLFYDNYFVPRGYAMILAQMNGTGFSTGCPHHGGPSDIASLKAVIDWLNGRVPGFDAAGSPKVADWHNGKAAMFGKSYDGTLANGVAATGVEGLTTIVPISAISAWYDYSRMGGIRFNDNYPSGLSNTVTNPARRALCAPTRDAFSQLDGDETGDINPFWTERDYVKDVSKVEAAVFATHGLQDDNVRMNHLSQWWDGLAANDVPRKLWLTRTGHVDPFDFRREEYVDTIHRWFDHWLLGVDNGIMDEPMVDVEYAADTWRTYADWPVPQSVETDVFLQGTGATSAGELGLSSGGAADTLGWTDVRQSETAIISNPDDSQANRRVFVSPVLERDLHLSGTPVIDIEASLDTTQTNLGAVLVDYGASTQVSRSGDGVANTNPPVRTCWGESSPDDSACYIEVSKRTTDVTQWRVSRGVLDSSNRDSLVTAEPAVPGQEYRFRWPLQPIDYVVPAGHRIGIVLVATFSGHGIAGTTGTTVTLDAKASRASLPIVGGYDAALASGAFAADTVPPVLVDMPADIAAEATGAAGKTMTYPLPTATDNEDPSPEVECTPASGSVFAAGTTTVTCTATDASGNTATDTFDVVMRRNEEVPVDVGGTVNPTLSLSLGGAAAFGAFTPGVARDYLASLTANVVSSAGSATLSVTDPSATAAGHLVNGAFALPSPLQVEASSAAGGSSAFAPIGGAATPLLAYTGPVSNDAATIGFKQPIGANDALRTGSYRKTLTFTLSTTAP